MHIESWYFFHAYPPHLCSIWNILESLIHQENLPIDATLPLSTDVPDSSSGIARRPPMFRRDMMSVSNFLVYQSPASILAREKSSSKLSLSEIIQRRQYPPSSSSATSSPMVVASEILEEEEGDGDDHHSSSSITPSQIEKHQIQKRMFELEKEYIELQQKLRLLDNIHAEAPSPFPMTTEEATCGSTT